MQVAFHCAGASEPSPSRGNRVRDSGGEKEPAPAREGASTAPRAVLPPGTPLPVRPRWAPWGLPAGRRPRPRSCGGVGACAGSWDARALADSADLAAGPGADRVHDSVDAPAGPACVTTAAPADGRETCAGPPRPGWHFPRGARRVGFAARRSPSRRYPSRRSPSRRSPSRFRRWTRTSATTWPYAGAGSICASFTRTAASASGWALRTFSWTSCQPGPPRAAHAVRDRPRGDH